MKSEIKINTPFDTSQIGYTKLYYFSLWNNPIDQYQENKSEYLRNVILTNPDEIKAEYLDFPVVGYIRKHNITSEIIGYDFITNKAIYYSNNGIIKGSYNDTNDTRNFVINILYSSWKELSLEELKKYYELVNKMKYSDVIRYKEALKSIEESTLQVKKEYEETRLNLSILRKSKFNQWG